MFFSVMMFIILYESVDKALKPNDRGAGMVQW